MSSIVSATAQGALSNNNAVIGTITLVAGGTAATCNITDAVGAGGDTIITLAAPANETVSVNLSGVTVVNGVFAEAVTGGTVYVELL